MGLALFNYESSNGAFPPACKSINLTTSPPSVAFPDTGFSVHARVLSFVVTPEKFSERRHGKWFDTGDWGKRGRFQQLVRVGLQPRHLGERPPGGVA